MGTGSSVKRIVLSTIFITAEFPLGLFHSVFYFFFGGAIQQVGS